MYDYHTLKRTYNNMSVVWLVFNMQRQQQEELVSPQYERINTFLNSIGRRSKNSRRMYATALRYFDRFLKTVHQSTHSDADIIILSLSEAEKKLDVYNLLDQFVSYLLQQNIALVHGTGYVSRSAADLASIMRPLGRSEPTYWNDFQS
jgi:hypothetical protein